jgi:modulator of FtsH protease HflK
VILDTGGGAGNLLYLPIDKLIEQGRRPAATESDSMTIEGSSTGDTGSTTPVERRTRGSR